MASSKLIHSSLAGDKPVGVSCPNGHLPTSAWCSPNGVAAGTTAPAAQTAPDRATTPAIEISDDEGPSTRQGNVQAFDEAERYGHRQLPLHEDHSADPPLVTIHTWMESRRAAYLAAARGGLRWCRIGSRPSNHVFSTKVLKKVKPGAGALRARALAKYPCSLCRGVDYMDTDHNGDDVIVFCNRCGPGSRAYPTYTIHDTNLRICQACQRHALEYQ